MAKTLPSTLFGTGGDEINQNCYKFDAKTQADLAASGKTLDQAFDSFTQTTHAALKKIGKTPVVWEGLSSVGKEIMCSDFFFLLLRVGSQSRCDAIPGHHNQVSSVSKNVLHDS